MFLLDLTRKALEELESPTYSVSSALMKALRIATALNDSFNLFWLEFETLSLNQEASIERTQGKFKSAFPAHLFKEYAARNSLEYVDERRATSVDILPLSVSELEADLKTWEERLNSLVTPTNLHPVDLYFVDKDNSQAGLIAITAIEERRKMLLRIKNRLHSYLRDIEQLLSSREVIAKGEPSESERVVLFTNLVAAFNDAELKELCFQLNEVEYDNLAGNTKNERVISLIQFFERRQTTGKLIDHLKIARPNRYWTL